MISNKNIFLFTLFFLPNWLMAQDTIPTPRLTMNGYLKDMQGVSFTEQAGSLMTSSLIHNRINLKYEFNSKWNARLEFRNRVFYGEQVKAIPSFATTVDQYNGLYQLSKVWVEDTALVIHTVIDRMVLQYAGDRWDIRVGRQRINWGINNIWNPNDVFNAYNFLDFDYSERAGTDAVRIQHFLKNGSTIEAAFKPSNKKDDAIGALMYRSNFRRYDYQVLGGVYRTDLFVGAGWAGHIGDAGFKGECSYFHPRERWGDTSGTVCLSLMADRTFGNDWYGSVSFLYNSHPNNMLNPVTGMYGNLSPKSLFPFRYTYYAGVSRSISPIQNLNFSLLWTPEKNIIILLPSWSWNVANNFDVDLTLQSFFGDMNAAYRMISSSLYLRGRWSF